MVSMVLLEFALPQRSPEKILRETFGKVAFGTSDHVLPGETVHLAAIPNLYTWKSAHSSLELKLRSTFNMPLYWEVSTVQGLGLTREESAESLLKKTMKEAMFGRLSLLENQPGQDPLPVAIGGVYKSVHFNDKQHDHNDPRLVNFLTVDYHPFFGFETGSLDDTHCHLWAGKKALLSPA